MLTQNVFTTAQIDLAVWPVEMLDRMVEFIAQDPRGEHYRELDWSTEYNLAQKQRNSQESAV
jgi:hypothetical protein